MPRKPKTPPALALDASLWLTAGGERLGGRARVALLQAIAENGSITQAAKAVGLSYKAAWDAVEAMNNLAGEPLVQRVSGGRGGGFTRLTERGQQLVQRYVDLDTAHQRFVRQLSDAGADPGSDIDLLRTLTLRTSARNQFAGRVAALVRGSVNDEVQIALPGGERIVAIVTHESSEAMGLAVGVRAFALVPSAAVLLATGLGRARLSTRNQFSGRVSAIDDGAVNAEVVLTLDGGTTIAALVTRSSVKSLGLAVDGEATALFKASSVIVGVAG